jgi:hypothetical protein
VPLLDPPKRPPLLVPPLLPPPLLAPPSPKRLPPWDPPHPDVDPRFSARATAKRLLTTADVRLTAEVRPMSVSS